MAQTSFDIIKARSVVSPQTISAAGEVFYVCNSSTLKPDGISGNNGNDGKSPSSPFSTITYALSKCTASRGDTIYVMEGHAETVSSAGGIAVNVDGVSIIGLGNGNLRPRITFGTVVGASMTVTANNVKIKNIIGVAGIDGLTSAFNVTGNNSDIDIEWQDASSTVEAETAVRLDTADNAILKIKYSGFTNGNAVVRAVAIDDCDNVSINIDAYGIVSTAWVNMVDTGSTNVSVNGSMYTFGISNFTRDVVDSTSASTWYAQIFDASAGFSVSGGSSSSLAADDVSAVASELSTIHDEISRAPGIASFPAAAVAANGVSLAEVVRYIQEVGVGVQGDAAVQSAGSATAQSYLKGILDILSGAAGITSFPSAAAPANTVSLAEVLRQIYNNTLMSAPSDLSNNHFTVTADFTSATWNTAASHEIVQVTGQVEIKIAAYVSGTITSAGGAATLILGDETTTNSLITSTDAENLAAGEWWFDNTDTRTVAARSIFEKTEFVIGNGKDVGYTIGTEALTGGSITFYVWWKPLDPTGSCVAGTGSAL